MNSYHEHVLNFIADMSAPIGPEVLAGFGTTTQNQILENPTDIDGILRQWLGEQDAPPLLETLLHIAVTVTLPEPYHTLRERFAEDWQYILTELLYMVIDGDRTRFDHTIQALGQQPCSQAIATDLTTWYTEAYGTGHVV